MTTFAATSAGVGGWMILFPETLRVHETMDWLDPINLMFLGVLVLFAAAVQFVSDAYLWLHARAAASSLLMALYVTFVVGIMRNDPTISVVPWCGFAVFELLLARRRL